MKIESGVTLIRKLLQFKELRPVPYWLFGLSHSEEGMAKRLDAFFGNRDWRMGVHEALEGNHIGFVKQSFGDGTAIDTFGVLLEEGNIAHVLRHPIAKPSLDDFKWPNPEEVIDWDSWKKHYGKVNDRIRLCGFAMGLFERSWYLRGFENIMIDMVQDPGFVEDLLDGILDIHLKVMEAVMSLHHQNLLILNQ